MFQGNGFQLVAFQTVFGGSQPANTNNPNGGSPYRDKEYQPTQYELMHRAELEKKLQTTKLDIKDNSREIERLELKRLRDLADQKMQLELLALLREEQRLRELFAVLQEQELIRMRQDDDMLVLLMCANF